MRSPASAGLFAFLAAYGFAAAEMAGRTSEYPCCPCLLGHHQVHHRLEIGGDRGSEDFEDRGPDGRRRGVTVPLERDRRSSGAIDLPVPSGRAGAPPGRGARTQVVHRPAAIHPGHAGVGGAPTVEVLGVPCVMVLARLDLGPGRIVGPVRVSQPEGRETEEDFVAVQEAAAMTGAVPAAVSGGASVKTRLDRAVEMAVVVLGRNVLHVLAFHPNAHGRFGLVRRVMRVVVLRLVVTMPVVFGLLHRGVATRGSGLVGRPATLRLGRLVTTVVSCLVVMIPVVRRRARIAMIVREGEIGGRLPVGPKGRGRGGVPVVRSVPIVVRDGLRRVLGTTRGEGREVGGRNATVGRNVLAKNLRRSFMTAAISASRPSARSLVSPGRCLVGSVANRRLTTRRLHIRLGPSLPPLLRRVCVTGVQRFPTMSLPKSRKEWVAVEVVVSRLR